ncbi:Gfo/Idh/MocA family oxidoreductase [Acidobacteria bacterium AH-259-L09]|nr:Gfo/Idh/MocA family oxidoreductase [Acidobacteria bacterium AH-259-L09]
MGSIKRREFLKKTAITAGLITSAPAVRKGFAGNSPNNRINIAVVGFHGRGRTHYREFAGMPNVRVAAVCDVDERLFSEAVSDIDNISGFKPRTEYDFRRLLDNKEIDAISIATPDHWHALMTIWACQAGKDVYVEKPISYTIEEGRKMVQAARKYERVVQVGTNNRSRAVVRTAMQYLHHGKLGDVYRAKAIILKGRASIGQVKDSRIPKGVHWDLFLGPAPYRPYNLSRFHYGWHFFWDTSTSDMGNSGVHQIDIARWGMNKRVHPVSVHCTGGVYLWDSDQETPNVQLATFEYADGKILDVELTNLFTNEVAGMRGTGNIFYTSKGYVTSNNGWETFRAEFKPREGDITRAGVSERVTNVSFPERIYERGRAIKDLVDAKNEESHFENFIDCMRSRRWQDLHADILEGHLSTTLCHLANISYRTGRKLTFNPYSERFVNDDDANSYLTRDYRHPYALPEKI